MFDISIHLMASLAMDGVRVISQNVIPLLGIFVREKTPFTTAAVWKHCSSLGPFLNSRHGLNDRFYPFYGDGTIAIQTGPALY